MEFDDGWNLLYEEERNKGGALVATRTYSWGPDISGTVHGAAGVGGLLQITETKGGTTTRSLPLYDGSGNITGLVDASTGALVAEYEYGPFGEMLSATGSRADSCPLRFSSKYYDSETGLYYFGYRYYDPETRSWMSRDPLGEAGGVNLYAYCGNDPVNKVDPDGLESLPTNGYWSGPFGGGSWSALGTPFYDDSGQLVAKMHYRFVPWTNLWEPTTEKDYILPLDQAKQLAPGNLLLQGPLPPRPTWLANLEGFSAPSFSEISNYIENHPGFNMQLGIYEGSLYAMPIGYGLGGFKAIFGARATPGLGLGLGGKGLYDWSKNDFAVTPRGLGNFIGGSLVGGGFMELGETYVPSQLTSFSRSLWNPTNYFEVEGATLMGLPLVKLVNPKFKIRGAMRLDPLRSASDAQIAGLFEGTGFTSSSHFLMRLREIRTFNLGLRTFKDMEGILRYGTDSFNRVDSITGHSLRQITYGRFNIVYDPITKDL